MKKILILTLLAASTSVFAQDNHHNDRNRDGIADRLERGDMPRDQNVRNDRPQDRNRDGVPDRLERGGSHDRDHDGIPNRYDNYNNNFDRGNRDRDHDGIPNRFDNHNNNFDRRPNVIIHQNPWRGNFHYDDNRHWNEGRWNRTTHDNRLGWWWIVGNDWFLYDEPVYPYPVMSVPPVIYKSYHGRNIPVNVKYYCPVNNTYYPYTPSCPVPWQKVYR